MFVQSLFEEFVGQKTRLRKAVHASRDEEMNVSVFVDFVVELVLLYDLVV